MGDSMHAFLIPWTSAQLNLIQTIALEMDRRGLTPAAVAAAAAERLESVATFGTPSAAPRRQQPSKNLTICPHCGNSMLPVGNTEGLRIIGCRKCRYSRIEE